MCLRAYPSAQCCSYWLGCVQRDHHHAERQVESSFRPCPELQDHLCAHIWRQEPDSKSHNSLRDRRSVVKTKEERGGKCTEATKTEVSTAEFQSFLKFFFASYVTGLQSSIPWPDKSLLFSQKFVLSRRFAFKRQTHAPYVAKHLSGVFILA